MVRDLGSLCGCFVCLFSFFVGGSLRFFEPLLKRWANEQVQNSPEIHFQVISG